MSGPNLSRSEINAALQQRAAVNPSRIDTFPGIWDGAPAVGSRWTVPQLATLERERAQAEALGTRYGTYLARLLADPERVEGFNVDLETRFVECPLLARSKDRSRVLIIAPGGDKLWRPAK